MGRTYFRRCNYHQVKGMRLFYRIFVATILALSLPACEGNIVIDESKENEVDIDVSSHNYITFLTEANTRGELIESNYITGSFGVFGYQYDFAKSWNGQRAIAKPEVFWNLKEGNKMPLKVTEDNGSYDYHAANAPSEDAGQITWSAKKYAFFAYYPYDLSVIDMESEGTPYLTYTVDKEDASNHVDVMTGGVSDITASSSSNTVTFTMNHRLAGVDVSICNAYEYTYQSGTDDEGDPVYTSEDIDIEITELTLNFANLEYESAKIFLEQNKAITSLNTVPGKGDDETAEFKLIGADSNSGRINYIIEPTTDENENITAATGTSMTFIPQSESDLSVIATIKYKKKRKLVEEYIYEGLDEEGNPLYDENGLYTVEKETTFDQSIKEGSRYYVLLTFTSEAVSINIITAAAWDEKEVEYEFV